MSQQQIGLQNSQPLQNLLQACAMRTQMPQHTFGKRGRDVMEQSQTESFGQMNQQDFTSNKLLEDYLRCVSAYEAMLSMSAQQYLLQQQSQLSSNNMAQYPFLNPSFFKTPNDFARKQPFSEKDCSFGPSISPMNKASAQAMRPEAFDLDSKDSAGRRRRCNEWTTEEIILLLHCTKLMINCELKTISQALFACIKRSPGKCWGRAAEKKLKRMKIFVNWKTCNKKKVLKKIDEKLEEFGELGKRIDPNVIEITRQLKQAEYSGMIKAK